MLRANWRGFFFLCSIFERLDPASAGFLFLWATMSTKTICRGCPHFDFAIAIAYEGNDGPRMDMTCDLGESAAGIRLSCDKRPERDNGMRRRETDMGGDASNANIG